MACVAVWLVALLLVLAPQEGAAQPAATSLVELYHLALATHPALRAQEAGVERAAARHDLARSRLRPQASATMSSARNDFRAEGEPTDRYNSYRHALTLRQPLLDVASWRQVEAESLRVMQSEQEVDVTRTDLAAELLERVLAVLDASEELVVVQAEKDAVRGQRSRLRRMVERQMARVTDLLEVDAHYVTLEAREIEDHNAVLAALEDLRETTGVEVNVLSPLAATDVPELTDDIEEWVRRGVDQSPRLAAARRAIEAEQSALASARAEHFPKVAITASKTWADTDSDNRRNQPYNVASVGVQLTIPIYEGGRVDAGVREALARLVVAQSQFEQNRREIEREVRSAWLKAEGGRLRINATLQSVEAQESAREAQQRGFDLRVVTIVDLLETQHRLFRARGEHARARHDYLRGLVTLRRYAGALAESDMEMFGAFFSGQPRELR
jgi:outer membrane protein